MTVCLLPSRFIRTLIVLTALLSGLISPLANADVLEKGRALVENFTARDYRGKPTLFGTVQDADGLMYFANYGAIVIYDGHRWDYIPISESPVLQLLPAQDGTMYISPFDDFGRATRDRQGKWQYESFRNRLPAAVRQPGRVWNIVQVGEDIVFSTDSHIVTLPKGNPEHAVLAPMHADSEIPPPRHSQQSIIALRAPGQEKLFWFHRGVGLHEYRNGQLIPYLPHSEALKDPRIAWIARDAQEEIRIIWDDGSVFTIDPQGQAHPWLHHAGPLMTDTFVRTALILPDGGMYFATATKGAVLVGPQGEIRHHLHMDNGLETNTLNGGYLDRDGGIWVTHMSGASRIEMDERATIFDQTNGIGASGLDLIVRHEGSLFGGSDEGVFRLDKAESSGQETRWKLLPTHVGRIRVLNSIQGELLLGTMSQFGRWENGGFTVFDNFNAQVTTLELIHNRIWLGHEKGIRVYERKGHNWQLLFGINGIDSPVLSIKSEGEESIWVGTLTRGLWKVQAPVNVQRADQIKLLHFTESDGISGNGSVIVNSTAEGLLFHTPDTFYRYVKENGAFKRDPRFIIEGQPVLPIEDSAFKATADGRIFAQFQQIGNQGIEQFFGWMDQDFTWHPLPLHYLQQLGPTGAVNLFYEEKGEEEILWATGAEGTLRIDLTASAQIHEAPPALIRSAQRDELEITPQQSRLPFSRSPIRFSYASPTYRDGKYIRFQSRLVNYHDVWSEPSERTEVEFTNLNGGNYIFEVRAMGADRRVGPAAQFEFSILPPWYRTVPALAGYLLCLGAAIAGVVRLRLRHSERERQRLSQLVETRTSELALAKEEADQANRAKSTFLANMSHELRTPLNGVLGYARIILRDKQLSPASREHAQIVASSGDHLLKMINEVLDFSKIEAGKIELRPAPFHLHGLLRDIEVAFAPRAQSRHLDFQVIRDDRLPASCLGDAQKLRQVIDNLLSNAFKFTPKGQVKLEVRCLDDSAEQILFSVSDTGVGLAPHELTKLFTPFHQPAEGRPPEPGTGLGLSICQRLVQLMGGEIEVTSNPGQGSCFNFTLPIEVISTEFTSPKTQDKAVTGYVGARKSVLIVDDVEVNRNLLRDLLAPLGFSTETFPDARSALARMEDFQFDAVILDQRMPDIDGLEMARRVRSQHLSPKPTIILTSASVLSFDPQVAFEAGCDDFLAKPFHEDELLNLLSRRLHLEWSHDSQTTLGNEPLATEDTPASDELIEPLRQAASRGDITRIKAILTELRENDALDPALQNKLERLAANYQMDQLRRAVDPSAT